MAFVGFKGLKEIKAPRDTPKNLFLGDPGNRFAALRMKEGCRGRTYSRVRGEIHRPREDEQQRRHSSRIPSSIKNQSVEIEDD